MNPLSFTARQGCVMTIAQMQSVNLIQSLLNRFNIPLMIAGTWGSTQQNDFFYCERKTQG